MAHGKQKPAGATSVDRGAAAVIPQRAFRMLDTAMQVTYRVQGGIGPRKGATKGHVAKSHRTSREVDGGGPMFALASIAP